MAGRKGISTQSWMVLVVLCLVSATTVRAIQPRYGARSEIRQTAGFSYSFSQFEPTRAACAVDTPDGECEQFQDFEFSNPILGLFYSRPGIQLFIGRGTQNGSAGDVGDLELLETNINIFGMARPIPGTGEQQIQIIVPYGLHSGFRRVTSKSGSTSTDQFEATVIAIGAGAGLVRSSGSTQFLIRFMPFFGLASQSLGFGNGTSTLLDGDVELTFGPVKGRIGIAIGYQYRWQKWNLEEDFVGDRDFKGTRHGFRVGIFW